jgi:hypothetical protein
MLWRRGLVDAVEVSKIVAFKNESEYLDEMVFVEES